MFLQRPPQDQRQQQRDHRHIQPLHDKAQHSESEHDVDVEIVITQRIGPDNAQQGNGRHQVRARDGKDLHQDPQSKQSNHDIEYIRPEE